ncbi:MAG: hypothetical protein WD602_06005 [Actinomycetota bacterium]
MQSSRMWVEPWSPEYGSSTEVDPALDVSEEEVDLFVETDRWSAVSPGVQVLPATVFIDGVDRVDARAFYRTASDGLVPGLFGSVGAGAVLYDGGSHFDDCRVERWGVFGAGQRPELKTGYPSTHYGSRSIAGDRTDELRADLQRAREELEVTLARELASDGLLVLADGPLRLRESLEVIGYIKSHQKTYLGADQQAVAMGLGAGQRTPIFQFGRVRPRFSWYLRLAELADRHPWAAIARCEVSTTVGVDRAVRLADLVTQHLPRFASKSFWDTRAPQNLVPIATLERRLWRLLGDRELVMRRINRAVMDKGLVDG